MWKLTITVAVVLMCFGILLAGEPTAPAPTEWRGVGFGMKRTEAEKVIRRSFADVQPDDCERGGQVLERITKASSTVDGHPVSVGFYFGNVTNTLCMVMYASARLSLDTTLRVFKDRYGEPSQDTTITFLGTNIRSICWRWMAPEFLVEIASGGDDVKVVYQLRDCGESQFKEKPKKTAASEY